jgi:hypothetical protein
MALGPETRSVLIPMPDWARNLDIDFDFEDLEAVYREALTVEEGLEVAEEGRTGAQAQTTVWGEDPLKLAQDQP